MDFLGPANEAHAGQAVAPVVNRFFRGCGDRRMLREAEIVICAEIKDGFTLAHTDGSALRRENDAFGFVSAGAADIRELRLKMSLDVRSHLQFKMTLPDSPDSMAARPFSNSV